MPPFMGSKEDRAALAAYLLSLNDYEVDGAKILELAEKKQKQAEKIKGGAQQGPTASRKPEKEGQP